ncbi:MAG: penicillin-insensitive murein endopeptidase [Polyangiaceae bacterium]|nr:penicillin-insensitive murein endopeptidase [Polyangiaceae bacterium]
MTRWCALGALALSTGCASVPTPLVPGARGSVGWPSYGVLLDATRMPPTAPGVRLLRPHNERNFGTKALVDTLLFAGDVTHARGSDPPLVVGDLSGPRGGKLKGHASHRVGRDVDLLFFYTTPAGVPLLAPGFVKVGPDGLAEAAVPGGFVRLDVPRTWALAKALLGSPHADVEWLFVAEWVEALLLEHARAAGEPDHLLYRAANVMHQPKDSAAHDDHFHLRIACAPDEEMSGCVSGGPDWPWRPVAALRDDPATLVDD